MKGILYYSSISGNTGLVAEAIKEYFRRADVELMLQNLAQDTTWKETNTLDFVLLGCGTYGHGQLQNMLRNCIENLWKDVQLKSLPCAAIGLGDHRYDLEYNMYAADILDAWLREHGGNVIASPLRINRSPVKGNNQKIIENWAKNFIITLRK